MEEKTSENNKAIPLGEGRQVQIPQGCSYITDGVQVQIPPGNRYIAAGIQTATRGVQVASPQMSMALTPGDQRPAPPPPMNPQASNSSGSNEE
jgi:hypothetical protein